MMNKTIITGLAALAIASSAQAQNVEDYLTREPTKTNFSIINRCIAEAKNIKHVRDSAGYDPQDYWQSPKETDSLKIGDTNDIAIYLQHLLKKNGIDSELCLGKYLKHDAGYKLWLEFKSDNKNILSDDDTVYVINMDMHGNNVFFRDNGNIEGTLNESSHIIEKYSEKLDDKINEYEKRNKVRLLFKNRRYASNRYMRRGYK